MSDPLSLPVVLTRGVEQILPSADGLAELMQRKKIRLYLGIDPTGNQLHLGHAVVLRKLQQFVELGHEVLLLIGNGTVRIGDPTGKDKTRPMLSDAEIEQNFQTWQAQASKILDFSKIKIVHNGDWLDKLTFADLVHLMATTTVQQLLERDMFQERLKNNLPVHAHELIYPLLQGYDSYYLDVDLELGGSDQIFNMMVGRQLQKIWHNHEKWVLGVPLLVGSDGRKMGKSLGNFIPLLDSPTDMYGKLMGITDQVIVEYFKLLTDVPDAEIVQIEHSIQAGENPMQQKKRLAQTITAWLHGEKEAAAAADTFQRVVQQKEIPSQLPAIVVTSEMLSVLDVVVASEVCASKAEARRLIEQGGVQLDTERLSDPQAPAPQQGVLRVGKRAYFRLTRETKH